MCIKLLWYCYKTCHRNTGIKLDVRKATLTNFGKK